ncbi:hypothetical protein FBU59_004147 [Linderina macrospora]|uniref:Uncharacterized protein n=1 Tax=Linderina macrospora TaxID=4868 RepID=A0ACC1J6E9_9FUNG|nr:hypothetical protein FBU59_004147 [Linderina macrospora]
MYDSAPNGHSYSTPSSPGPYSSQPTSSDSKPTYDKELASLFRATAANVTQLYKEASEIGQAAYRSGYEQCYNDILELALATAHMPGNEGQPLTLQQLLEFARQKRITPKPAFQHAATSRMMQANSSQGTYFPLR